MQVVFHSDIEDRAGRFSLDDVADAAVKKLIRRHPHVFGDTCVDGSREVIVNWDMIKREEKNQDMTADAMRSVARSLPALWRAEKIQKKASRVGFDYPDCSGAMEALREELCELGDAVASGIGVADELGDLIFSAVNVARFFDVDTEGALGGASDRFVSRFERVESAAAAQGRGLDGMSIDEIDEIYREVKLEG
jgi:tetrapyrrole methylase family protein/MazG family protein